MNKLPKRKNIRLKGYDYSSCGYYFITVCTHQRQCLFSMSFVGNDLRVVPEKTPQNLMIEKWINELQNKFYVTIDKYVIMHDHIHLILIIDTERHAGRSLPDIMQWFKTMTTNEYIKLVRNGMIKPFNKKLWQKSYYEHIIRDDRDYEEIAEYIMNNPLKYAIDKTTQDTE